MRWCCHFTLSCRERLGEKHLPLWRQMGAGSQEQSCRSYCFRVSHCFPYLEGIFQDSRRDWVGLT